MQKVELQNWTKQGQELLDRTRAVIENAPLEDVRNLLSRVPTAIAPDEDKVRIVFAGQYSAGKSSLIKVMTGEDVAIGAAITTDTAQAFDWGDGVTIVDTPGIHTEKRRDHDEITYDEIGRADLLVFVITYELFDSHLGEHFRELAIDRSKGNEMLLVVNKMADLSGGNTRETQRILTEDVRKVLAPFTPEQLRITFIDAQSELDAEQETDEDFAQIYRERSGVAGFLKTFDGFIRAKGLASRYTTALYTAEQVLLEALKAETSGDKDVDATKELALQTRRALLQAKMAIPIAVDRHVQKVAQEIHDKAYGVTSLMHVGGDQAEINEMLQQAQSDVQLLSDSLANSVEASVSNELSALEADLARIADSELARMLIPRIKSRIAEELGGIDLDSATTADLKGVSDVTNTLGRMLLSKSIVGGGGTNLNALTKLSTFSGSPMHTTVKGVGHFFGKSFQPWQAVTWTRNIAYASIALSVVGLALSFILDMKAEEEERKLEAKLRESRAAVQKGFNDAANVIDAHFDEATQSYITEVLDPQIKAADDILNELSKTQTARSQMFYDLEQLLTEVRALITEMHNGRAEG